jgi:hypothetical protein
MHLGVRELAAAISSAAIIFCCSCEKHRLGEDPEVQKEQVDPAKAGGEETSTTAEKKEAEPSASPTPANFFPQTTPEP